MPLIDDIKSFIATGPVVFVYLFLLVSVFLRAQGTYWLGRYMWHVVSTRGRPAGGWRLKLYHAIHADSTARVIGVLQRRGWPIIPLSFLTVGLQTVVQFAAGILSISWPRYTLAMVPGTIAWAFIYTTVGWAVWEATLGAVAGSPWALIALVSFAGLLFWWRHTRTRKAVATL
ncbi:VTT domain-containing protein [Trueperella pecoris]|uniref:VTT domain-containing protein n=1 Tax=Trueperella pecoris TaxID=2733571 RepID=A0A7M1R2E8_9ACTO|nr:VTT domain-containing protein [Trueperella pecoris]QOR48449.1 VTT domain-containing protein [Trueperella pecoris]